MAIGYRLPPSLQEHQRRNTVSFKATQFVRTGTLHANATIERVFPLLCPKREEEWIPGWECETIWSKSGYNEEGAIFRTTKPYGTELYWTTLRYDLQGRTVDFLITAPRLYVFRFTITVGAAGGGVLPIVFTQVFTSVSDEGNVLLKRYETDDFNARLRNLEELMNQYLVAKE
jgi:hypothetical protein